MESHPPRRPAAPPAPAASATPPAGARRGAAAPPGRDRWTPAKQRIFLTALLDSGSVARAARAAGMSRSSAHRLRLRLAGTPFDRLWDQVLALHAQRLADPFAADPVAPAAHGGAPAVASPAQQ